MEMTDWERGGGWRAGEKPQGTFPEAFHPQGAFPEVFHSLLLWDLWGEESLVLRAGRMVRPTSQGSLKPGLSSEQVKTGQFQLVATGLLPLLEMVISMIKLKNSAEK